jgi:hypothetical protein
MYDDDGGDGFRHVEARCWPAAHVDSDDDGWIDGGATMPLYLCGFLPRRLTRCLARTGLDCGVRFSTTGLPGWMLGTRSGRHCCLIFLLVVLVLVFGWSSYQRGHQTQAILASPCYVCAPPSPPSSIYDLRFENLERQQWWRRSPDKAGDDRSALDARQDAVHALQRYAVYAHGPGCALDDGWVAALEQKATLLLERAATSNATTPTHQEEQKQQQPWLRYDRWFQGAAFSAYHPLLEKEGNSHNTAQRPEADWRHTLPRAYLVGFRGAGTTSLWRYLQAHPDIVARHQPHDLASVTSTDSGRNRKRPSAMFDKSPWDNHFFASVPDWTPEEIRGWVRRGWGPASLRDHRGQGPLRLEVGPDYLWFASTGAAAAIRRAQLPPGSGTSQSPKFIVLLADPVRLIREAHARAVDAGVEERKSLADVVAQELPALAKCLWWDQASLAEQEERILSGLCGAGTPGRVGPPYLWRGFLSVYVSHWIRTATPGQRRQWHFVRSEDLLLQPNRTLNRLVVQFLGLKPIDFEPFTRRLWHPDPDSVHRLAAGAPYAQSWKSYVPRLEFIKHARKRATDALLDGASRAARRVVPGLDAALKTREKLKQLHCKLAGVFDKDAKLSSLTNAGKDCLEERQVQRQAAKQQAKAKKRKKHTSTGDKGNKAHDDDDDANADAAAAAEEQAQLREARAEEALRDFFGPYHDLLLDMVQDIHALQYRFASSSSSLRNGPSHAEHQDPTQLRDFYLANTDGPQTVHDV